jgi:hypothetical protein
MPNGRVCIKRACGNADEAVVLAISPVVSAIGGSRLDGSFREATRVQDIALSIPATRLKQELLDQTIDQLAKGSISTFLWVSLITSLLFTRKTT